MMKKLLKSAAAVLAASLLLFIGCSSDSGSDDENLAMGGGDLSQDGEGNTGDKPSEGSTVDKPTTEVPVNATVQIVKSEGWLNSAYIIFEQIEGATYTVKCDDVAIDEPLIRYYDEYVWYEPTESADLSVRWERKTLNNVVRADALGLAAGNHTMSVCANGTNGSTDYSSVTMTVADHDRQGFAFTGTETPGAYNKDGTLKSGTVVIYLTEDNKKTVKATIGKIEYTGIAAITQAVKTKNTGSAPVDIRIIGKLTLDGLSCADMSSAYALGVKEASNVTIEGVGHDATLVAGVAAFKSSNIEISNLGLMKWGGGSDGDGVSLKESKYVWVHNNDFFYGDAGSDKDQVKGDGSMDLKDDSQYVTVAYNHFWDSGKMSLCGMKSESGPNYITYHHNWFDHSDSRHPRVRTMSVHVYNNYFDGNAKYGIGVTSGGNIFAEGNYFRNAHSPMLISMQGTDAQGDGTFSGESGGQIKAFNNKFEQNNMNDVKFQFRTNKYDYTNGKELGEYKEITDKIGTDNGDGTYTIYSWNYGNSFPSFITKSNATDKSGYYQIGSGKDGFSLSIPAGTVTVMVKAKVGSSSASSATLKVGSISAEISGDYADYEFKLIPSADTTVSIAASGASINVKSITVIASELWETTYSVGADMSDIDAYEVDTRSETVPATVTSKSGSYKYSNFDTVLGDTGLGLSAVPSNPDQAKQDVLDYSGRHCSDFAWDFTNSTDDASYAVNIPLNTALVSHKTSLTKIQNVVSDSGNTGGGEADTKFVTAILISAISTEIKIGQGITLASVVEPSDATNKGVTWISSDKSVATVDNSGKVKGIKAGTATITAVAADGSNVKSNEISITVSAVKVESITVSGSVDTVEAGKEITLTATAVPADASEKGVTWESSDTSIATVDNSGKVRGIKAGTVTITATTKESGSSVCGTKEITVKPVVSISVPSSKTLYLGTDVSKSAEITVDVNATGVTEDEVTIEASSIDTDKATVSVNGKTIIVMGAAAGETAITVTAKVDGTEYARATIEVTVKSGEVPTVQLVTVSAADGATSVKAGKTLQLTATISPTEAADIGVTWKSSDESKARVDVNGLVTGVAKTADGEKVTITATAGGKEGTIELTVEKGGAVVIVTFDSFTSGSPINGVTVTGNLKSGIASKTYGGTTYTTALKMETSTSISFTLDNPASLTLVTDAASKGIKIDGTKKMTDADGVVSGEVLEAGSHTVTKGDTINLYAIIITSE